MLKNISNLEGAQQLTKDEQKNITGGRNDVNFDVPKCLCNGIWVLGVDCDNHSNCPNN